jgi:hypothetical protein
LPCKGIARNVPISIAGEAFSITCVGLNLGCFDVIIGVDFLRTLGPILWDLEAMTLAFWREGRHVLWKGAGGTGATAPQRHLVAAVVHTSLPLLEQLLQ